MVAITCPNCAADLDIPAGSPIHTCDYCGTAIQVKIATGEAGEGAQKEDSIIKDHYIIRCKYPQEKAKNLMVEWVKKIPGAPQDFESVANIHTLNLKFYPLWVGQYKAITDYVGLDDWPQFNKPAHDRPGWYEHVSYYKREENGKVLREYQIPLMALPDAKLPKYLREYLVTTTGKEYFDINHVKKLGGQIIDSTFEMDEAKQEMNKQVHNRQTKEVKKEVTHIKTRNDDLEERGVFYIHFPVYEIEFSYGGKAHDALIDGSSGRIIHVKVPVSKEFRVQTLISALIFIGAGLGLLIPGTLVQEMLFIGLIGGIGLMIVGVMFIALNLRRKASERQV